MNLIAPALLLLIMCGFLNPGINAGGSKYVHQFQLLLATSSSSCSQRSSQPTNQPVNLILFLCKPRTGKEEKERLIPLNKKKKTPKSPRVSCNCRNNILSGLLVCCSFTAKFGQTINVWTIKKVWQLIKVWWQLKLHIRIFSWAGLKVRSLQSASFCYSIGWPRTRYPRALFFVYSIVFFISFVFLHTEYNNRTVN